MKLLRVIFFPIMVILYILHMSILFFRNKLYDLKIYNTFYFKDVKIISVGSLKLGGAGKTPLVEYIINILPKSKIALLSRGYKRKSSGFLFAKKNHSAYEIGDEANQIHKKNLDITVAVDKDRVRGVNKIIQKRKKDLIILDDAYQHRRLKKDLNILVTEYEKLFSKDYLFPLGNLREYRSESQRANIIVVTKCPKNIHLNEQENIKKNLSVKSHQKVFFSHISEYKFIHNNQRCDLEKNKKYFLVTGIANVNPLLKKLREMEIEFSSFEYSDHYFFKKSDIKKLIKKGKKEDVKEIIITEKDYYRLSKDHLNLIQSYFKLFYTQIEFDFITEEKSLFNKQILKFI